MFLPNVPATKSFWTGMIPLPMVERIIGMWHGVWL